MTREEYMNSKTDDAHRTYYGQFVDQYVSRLVKRYIGLNKIRQSTDKHFNDIPLSIWDGLHGLCWGLAGKQARIFGESKSLCFTICVLKEAALQLKETSKVKQNSL
jgi:hypothetical protein